MKYKLITRCNPSLIVIFGQRHKIRKYDKPELRNFTYITEFSQPGIPLSHLKTAKVYYINPH